MDRDIAGICQADAAFGRALVAQMRVAEGLGVSLLELCRNMRGDAHTVFARQLAMYLCHLVFAMRVMEIADAFRRDRSTVRHALNAIEEAREDAATDRLIGFLEAALREDGHV